MKPHPNFHKLVLNPDHIFGLKESLEWARIYFNILFPGVIEIC